MNNFIECGIFILRISDIKKAYWVHHVIGNDEQYNIFIITENEEQILYKTSLTEKEKDKEMKNLLSILNNEINIRA